MGIYYDSKSSRALGLATRVRGLSGGLGLERWTRQDCSDRLMGGVVGRFGDHRCWPAESSERLREGFGAKGALAIRDMRLFVPVRVADVREMDVERHVRRQSVVDRLECCRKPVDRSERAVARRMHVSEIGNGAHPLELARDCEHVVESPELLRATHHLDPERDEAALGL